MKTRKTITKRFKQSHPKRGRAKLLHNTQGINHLTGKRDASRQDRNSKDKVLASNYTKKIKKLISNSKI